ncbi:MAG: hypothetical protein ACRD3D_00960 [Terriglobia bacterium]
MDAEEKGLMMGLAASIESLEQRCAEMETDIKALEVRAGAIREALRWLRVKALKT